MITTMTAHFEWGFPDRVATVRLRIGRSPSLLDSDTQLRDSMYANTTNSDTNRLCIINYFFLERSAASSSCVRTRMAGWLTRAHGYEFLCVLMDSVIHPALVSCVDGSYS